MEKLYENAPWAAATAAIVFGFLKYLASTSKANQSFLREMHLEHLDARKMSREAIDKNTASMIENAEATSRNSELLTEVKVAMRDFADELRNCNKR